ncbi:MAG: hypothetical protein EOO86_02515 [Pedobacter sp.]|nr:MAG: hypothetical protein EOO86_02515 [Pedobacter sp.]
MRIIIIFLVFALTGSLKAQTVKFNIEGVLQKNKNAKFAYLVSNGIVPGKGDLFLVQPMNGNSFHFNGTADLAGKLLRTAFIFLDERGDITLSQVKEKIEKKVWFVGGTANLKMIYLENIKLDIENQYNLQPAKITAGGSYLQQSKDAMQAIRERRFLAFVKEHSDSPVALDEVSKMVKYVGFANLAAMDFGSPGEMYAALSKRLKSTTQGIELKQKIDQNKLK